MRGSGSQYKGLWPAFLKTEKQRISHRKSNFCFIKFCFSYSCNPEDHDIKLWTLFSVGPGLKSLKTAEQPSGFTDGESEAQEGQWLTQGPMANYRGASPSWPPSWHAEHPTPSSLLPVSTQIGICQVQSALCMSLQTAGPLGCLVTYSLLSPHSTEHHAELLEGTDYSPGESLRWGNEGSRRRKGTKMSKKGEEMQKATMFVSSWTPMAMMTRIRTTTIH